MQICGNRFTVVISILTVPLREVAENEALPDRSWPRRRGVTALALISKNLVGETNATITVRPG